MLRRRLAGLAASLVIIGILAGLPIVLLAAVGNPIPGRMPTLQSLFDALSTPDDGTLALRAIALAGWVVWAVLSLTVLAEIIAQIRQTRAPRLPGFHLPQQGARQLVATAAALFVVAPLVLGHTVPSFAESPQSTIIRTVDKSAEAHQHVSRAIGSSRPPTMITQTVLRGDTLSELAERHLGEADRWPQIFDASRDVRQPDGRTLTDPDLIVDGWTLRIPHSATPEVGRPHPTVRHTVREGDTLAGIAAATLGDSDRWTEIYELSTDVRQPDGERLTDPDLIRPGWTLRIPSATPAETTVHHHPTKTKPASPTPAPHPSGTPASSPSVSPSTTASSPAPTSAPSSKNTEVTSAPAEPTVTAPTAGLDAPWLLTGLAAGGAVLAGSALLVLRRRREHQMRSRRPGTSIPRPAPGVRPVEKSIIAVGSVSADVVRRMDLMLRELAAAHVATGRPMPPLDTVELTDEHVVLHLAKPAQLAAPWIATPPGGRHWQAPHSGEAEIQPAVDQPAVDQPAPYPLLVTAGTGDDGHLWLINLEGLGVVEVGGDRTYGEDWLRYLAAELALNPWSRDVTLGCLGVDGAVAPMNVERVRVFDTVHAAAVAMSLEAAETLDRCRSVSATTISARTAQLAEEAWFAQVLIIGDTTPDDAADALLNLVREHPTQTATTIITREHDPDPAPEDRVVTIDDHGLLEMPSLGLSLTAVGLTPDETQGCVLLLAQADIVEEDDSPALASPTADSGPGATGERQPQPDRAAPAGVVVEVEDGAVVDPELDDDVAAWFAEVCDRPRLTLLGPVNGRANGTALARRKSYYVEILAYLHFRPNGARPEEVQEAFGLKENSVRSCVKILRDWLGVNPRTGKRHLPEAPQSTAAITRGVPVYEVDDILVDLDLFDRLRARAAHSSNGMEDLCTALRLVSGRPFDQLRPAGWSWLVDLGTDYAAVCAIVDVAHTLVERFLEAGEPARAKAAAEVSILAAPTDAIPKLDLAAVASHEGRHREAKRIALQVVTDASVDGVPGDLDQRTARLLAELVSPHEQRAAS